MVEVSFLILIVRLLELTFLSAVADWQSEAVSARAREAAKVGGRSQESVECSTSNERLLLQPCIGYIWSLASSCELRALDERHDLLARGTAPLVLQPLAALASPCFLHLSSSHNFAWTTRLQLYCTSSACSLPSCNHQEDAQRPERELRPTRLEQLTGRHSNGESNKDSYRGRARC
jgi:hypothetical protein